MQNTTQKNVRNKNLLINGYFFPRIIAMAVFGSINKALKMNRPQKEPNEEHKQFN